MLERRSRAKAGVKVTTGDLDDSRVMVLVVVFRGRMLMMCFVRRSRFS